MEDRATGKVRVKDEGKAWSFLRSSPHRWRTLGEVILPDGMNLNQELVKQGWCWWYWKYAPGDTVLEGLEKEAREAKKGHSFVIRPLILPAN